MKTLLAVFGPYDGQALTVPDHVTRIKNPAWPGVYERQRVSPNIEVFAYGVPGAKPDRWAPRRRTAHFEVDRQTFGR